MGKKSRAAAQKRLERERAQRRAAAAAAAAARPPVPAKKSRANEETDESMDRPRRSGSNPRPPPRHVHQPAPLRLVLGERSAEDRDPKDLTWICDCGKTNYPRRGLIADIPVLRCQCGHESEIDFDFSLANVSINGQSPIIKENVKKQKKKGCTLAATTSNMEITLQMRAILSGKKFKRGETIIDMEALDDQYECVRKRPGVNKDERNDPRNITVLGSIAKHIGVITDKEGKPKINKLPEYLKVNGDFYDIVRVLADGQPLTTGFVPGKNFGQLKPGQIYKAPRAENLVPGQHSIIGHAILLVGAGRRGNTNYYHFLNSWGKKFCVEQDGRYGFGMLRATDIITQPVKFIRYQEEVEYHKMLASTDLSSLG